MANIARNKKVWQYLMDSALFCLIAGMAVTPDRLYEGQLRTIFANAVTVHQAMAGVVQQLEVRWAWLGIPLGFLMGTAMFWANTRLAKLDRSWLERKLLPWARPPEERIALYPYIGMIYLAFFAYLMPLIVFIEESIFRVHKGLLMGFCIGSVAFALVHLASGVTVRYTLLIAFSGLLLVAVYQVGGLWEAVLVHLTSNMLAWWRMSYDIHLKKPLRRLTESRRFQSQFPTLIKWANWRTTA